MTSATIKGPRSGATRPAPARASEPAEPDTAVTLTHRAIARVPRTPAGAREPAGVTLAEDTEYEPAWRGPAETATGPG